MGFDDQNVSEAVNPRRDRVHSDNYVLNELKRIFTDNTDAFGKLIADGTRNNLDIASHYKFSPERLRLKNNGSRQFVQYGETTNFTDGEDVWTLQPDAGDVMSLETAESSTYVVGYSIAGSCTFQLNQELQTGDVLKFGMYGDDNGWFMEQRGSDHTSSQVDIIKLQGGVRTTLATDVELSRPTTEYNRYELRYNWYGVGNQIWIQTYTENGEQLNDLVAKTSVDGGRGPESGNLNGRYEIEASGSTTGLELDGGSFAILTLGDPTAINRSKLTYKQVDVTGTADTWEPVYAIRIDPSNDRVNMQLNQLNILDYGANADIEAIMASFDASKTNATGWSRPPYHHEQNSAVQATTNVSQVPREDGTVKILEAGEMYGGYTLGTSVSIDGGNSSGDIATATSARQEKKNILASDHVVLLARSGTGGALDFVFDIDQNW